MKYSLEKLFVGGDMKRHVGTSCDGFDCANELFDFRQRNEIGNSNLYLDLSYDLI